jgi:hypothetical protein
LGWLPCGQAPKACGSRPWLGPPHATPRTDTACCMRHTARSSPQQSACHCTAQAAARLAGHSLQAIGVVCSPRLQLPLGSVACTCCVRPAQVGQRRSQPTARLKQRIANITATAPAVAVQVPRRQNPQRHPACIMERPQQSNRDVSPCTAATWPQQRVSLWCMLLHQPPLQPMPAVQCQMHAA